MTVIKRLRLDLHLDPFVSIGFTSPKMLLDIFGDVTFRDKEKFDKLITDITKLLEEYD